MYLDIFLCGTNLHGPVCLWRAVAPEERQSSMNPGRSQETWKSMSFTWTWSGLGTQQQGYLSPKINERGGKQTILWCVPNKHIGTLDVAVHQAKLVHASKSLVCDCEVCFSIQPLGTVSDTQTA